MRVGFLSSDWHPAYRWMPGGTTYVRACLPVKALREAGHEAWAGHEAKILPSGEIAVRDETGELRDGLDAVVLIRWMDARAVRTITRARKAGQVIVQDLDDDVWTLGPWNRAYFVLSPDLSPENNWMLYREGIAASSAVTVSTDPLATRAREFCSGPVERLRNAIDVGFWSTLRARIVTRWIGDLGWTGAIAWRLGDLDVVSDPIHALFDEMPELRFTHIGRQPGLPTAAEILGIKSERTMSVEMVSIIDLPTCLRLFHIGIAPMADRAFNRAKSALKGMEYAAAGLPFVASRTPEYEWFGGPTAGSSEEWYRELRKLLVDDSYRRDLTASLIARVALEDISLRGKEWVEFYEALIDKL